MFTRHRNDVTPLILWPELVLITCIAASALTLLAGLIAPVDRWIKDIIYIISAIFVCYDLLIDSIAKLLKEHDIDDKLFLLAAVIITFLIGRPAEAAAAALLFRAGTLFKDKLAEKYACTIQRLIDRRPEVVNAIIDGALVKLSIAKVSVGTLITVAPGETIPLDGIVVRGESTLDGSALTGDSAWVDVSEGSAVLSGYDNLTDILDIQVTSEFDDSTVTRILRIAEKGLQRRAKPEKIVKRISRVFTPAAVAAALIAGILVPLLGGLPFEDWVGRAVCILVIASPYAALVSLPLTYFAAIGGAVKKGILFQGADVVDSIAKTTSIVFDITNSLASGTFRVVDVNAETISGDRLLMLAAYAFMKARHPMARAIIEAADIRFDQTKIAAFREIAGKGTEVEIAGGLTVVAGNLQLLSELGIEADVPPTESRAVYVAVNGRYVGRILLSEAVKLEAKTVVRELHELGIDRVVIFTSSKKETVADVAKQLGIREVYAECLPEDKVTRLKGLTDMQLEGDKLVFVGDGHDDASIMKIADIGVTLNGLSSADFSEAADVIVLDDEPSRIATAIQLGRSTGKIIQQNILIALALKGPLLLLILLGVMPIWLVLLIDLAASIMALINAMRALGMDQQEIREIFRRSKELGSDGIVDLETEEHRVIDDLPYAENNDEGDNTR